jgi:hypothetical protein
VENFVCCSTGIALVAPLAALRSQVIRKSLIQGKFALDLANGRE